MSLIPRLLLRSTIRCESALAGRSIHTTVAKKDIDSAAKYIGAGAATVGVAGSVSFCIIYNRLSSCSMF